MQCIRSTMLKKVYFRLYARFISAVEVAVSLVWCNVIGHVLRRARAARTAACCMLYVLWNFSGICGNNYLLSSSAKMYFCASLFSWRTLEASHRYCAAVRSNAACVVSIMSHSNVTFVTFSCVTWSEVTCRGIPVKCQKSYVVAVLLAVRSVKGYKGTQRVKQSINTRMCLYPEWLSSKGPIVSMLILRSIAL